MQNEDSYPLQNYLAWAVSETPLGRWRREHIFDPLRFLGRKVLLRNYEAGYNVAELEPPSRKDRTYVLQEYFVPVAAFQTFKDLMVEIFSRHNVNVLNVSRGRPKRCSHSWSTTNNGLGRMLKNGWLSGPVNSSMLRSSVAVDTIFPTKPTRPPLNFIKPTPKP